MPPPCPSIFADHMTASTEKWMQRKSPPSRTEDGAPSEEQERKAWATARGHVDSSVSNWPERSSNQESVEGASHEMLILTLTN